MKKRLLLVLALALSAEQAISKQPVAIPGKVSDLSTLLNKLGDACSSKASDFERTDSLQQSLMEIDASSRAQKVNMDTQLYGMSHGTQQTEDYQLTLIQKKADDNSAAQSEDTKRIVDEAKQLGACLQSAEVDGKSAYTSFKNDRNNKSVMESATSLMTAWLVNLKTISIHHAKGSDETRPLWQAAKARAELDSL
jgi:hypothetical protein